MACATPSATGAEADGGPTINILDSAFGTCLGSRRSGGSHNVAVADYILGGAGKHHRRQNRRSFKAPPPRLEGASTVVFMQAQPPPAEDCQARIAWKGASFCPLSQTDPSP